MQLRTGNQTLWFHRLRRKQPKEFILGKYDAKGAVCFVLDMLVTDDECWTVQHMLHEIEVFGHKQTHCEGQIAACNYLV